MSMPRPEPIVTVDDYLTRERASLERHEFLDGRVVAMAGESDAHGIITVNITGSFYNQLRGTRCQARAKDTKVRSGPIPMPGHGTRGLFSYPDIVVICGEPEYHDAFQDVILNPVAIVEVLSPTTEALDRGAKFTGYQTYTKSLTDYLLVSQDQPQLEYYARQADDTWSYRRYTGLDATVAIASIRCTLKLADVYDRVFAQA
jgi:Uma2 family endonuclease